MFCERNPKLNLVGLFFSVHVFILLFIMKYCIIRMEVKLLLFVHQQIIIISQSNYITFFHHTSEKASNLYLKIS